MGGCVQKGESFVLREIKHVELTLAVYWTFNSVLLLCVQEKSLDSSTLSSSKWSSTLSCIAQDDIVALWSPPTASFALCWLSCQRGHYVGGCEQRDKYAVFFFQSIFSFSTGWKINICEYTGETEHHVECEYFTAFFLERKIAVLQLTLAWLLWQQREQKSK